MVTQDPTVLLLMWFDSLPPRQRALVAFLHIFCTADDTADWVLLPDEAIDKFRHFISRIDLPIRRVIRVVMTCAFFDFVFGAVEGYSGEFLAGEKFPWYMWRDNEELGVVSLDAKMWQRTAKAWNEFRRTVLSDELLRAYGKAVWI